MRKVRDEHRQPRKGDDVPTAGRKALRTLLEPLAGFVLEAGLSVHEFEQIFRIAAVISAADRQRELTGRLSISGIAALTGIPRAEISRILKKKTQEPSPDLQRHAANRILSVWHEEPEYQDDNGAPAVLPIFGESPSFDSLVRVNGRGIPTRAMLDELVRTGSVEVLSARRVRVKSLVAVSHGVGPLAVRAFGDTAAELMDTMLSNIRDPGKFHFVSNIQAAVGKRDVLPVFRKETSSRGQTFLAGLQEIFHDESAAEGGRNLGQSSTRVGVTVFYSEKTKNITKSRGALARQNLRRK